MGLSKGEKTKLRVLECATDLFFEHGIEKVSTRQIATIVGITQPAIYTHFASVEAIILGAVQHWVVEAQTFIDANVVTYGSANEQLKSMIEQNLIYSFNNQKKDALFLALFQLSLRSSVAKQIYEQVMNGGTKRIAILLDRGNRDSSWSVSDRDDMARAIHNLMLGEIHKLILSPDEMTLEARIKHIFSAVDRLLAKAEKE